MLQRTVRIFTKTRIIARSLVKLTARAASFSKPTYKKRSALKLKTTTRCCAAIFGLSLAGSVSAAGFQLLEQNASGLGNAYAGSAVVAENASTIFYNPAGMTQLKDREVSVGVNLIKPSFKFTDEGSSAGTLAGNGGDAGGWNVVPNAYGSFAANDKLYFGMGVSAPFGLKTEYPNPWVGGAQSLVFEIKTVNLNPSVAYKIDPNLSVGFGLNVMKADASYERIVGVTNAVYTASTATLDINGTGYGWNTGVLYSPAAGTKLGLSYRSQVKQKMTGSIKVAGPSAALNAAGTSDVKAELDLPDTWLLSASQQFGPCELLADISYIGWGSIPKVDIIRTSATTAYAVGSTAQTLDTNFRDTWRVALGGNYKMNTSWKLKTGLAWDQTPVKNAESRMVSLPDNDRIWLSLGAQWSINKESTLDLGAAYLFIKDTKINNNQAAAARGTVTGTYQGSVTILGAQYSQAF